MTKIPDIQSTESLYRIGINQVGVKNLIKKVKIKRNHESYTLGASFSAYVELPRNMRGIHMSRNPESIEEVINEHSFKPVSSVEGLAKTLAEKLLDKHDYSSTAIVEIKGIVIIEMLETSGGKVQKAFDIQSKAISRRVKDNYETKIYLGISSQGMTSCPCAQELIKDYSRKIILQRQDQFKINEENVDNLLDLIPLASHSQRSKGTIIVELNEPNIVSLLELIDIIQESMSAKIGGDVLKRIDEGKMVRLSHLNPRFVEDSIRIMASLAVKRLEKIQDECEITFRIDSMESIHDYNAFAEKTSTFKELRNEVQED